MTWRQLPAWERDQLSTRLTDMQFAVYVLREDRKASWQTIAQVLTASVWTVRTHYFRACQVHDEIRREAA